MCGRVLFTASLGISLENDDDDWDKAALLGCPGRPWLSDALRAHTGKFRAVFVGANKGMVSRRYYQYSRRPSRSLQQAGAWLCESSMQDWPAAGAATASRTRRSMMMTLLIRLRWTSSSRCGRTSGCWRAAFVIMASSRRMGFGQRVLRPCAFFPLH